MSKYRSHEIECALELYSSEPFVMRPSELYSAKDSKEIREELEQYNIYIVARRPRLSLIPESLHANPAKNIVSGVMEVHLGRDKKQLSFTANFNGLMQIEKLGGQSYPYDFLAIWSPTHSLSYIKLHDLLRLCTQKYFPITDMYVEYIGQAFGKDGERDVVDRLLGNTGQAGHGTLQRVLAEVNSTYPDQEVHLLLYSFGFHKRYVAGGGFFETPEPRHTIEETPTRLDDFAHAEIKRNIRIDLVEASLIRYFAPSYNKIYKKSFPAESHKILDRLHELDITGLAVSISTEEHKVRLYSDTVKPTEHHLAMYPITKDQNRLSIFELAPQLNE